MKPTLAQSMDLKDVPKYVADDRFACQQKLDGHRVLVEVDDGKVIAYNRAGDARSLGLPPRIHGIFAQTLSNHWVFDGELIGGTYWIFDLLHAMHVLTPAADCKTRLHVLGELFAVWTPPADIRPVPAAYTAEDKAALVKRVYENGGEGVIFRDLTKPYAEGRRTPALLKAKFISDADCVVMSIKHEGKDNLVLGAYRNGRLVEVGHCTALSGNGLMAKPGDVVVVQYLYMTDDGRLYQPTKPRIRDDKRPDECTMEQFRHVNKEVLV